MNLEMVAPDVYEDWLVNGDHPQELQEYLALAIAQLDGDGASDSPFTFNSDKTQEFLAHTDVTCAKPDPDFVKTMIQYGIQMGYFPEPSLVYSLMKSKSGNRGIHLFALKLGPRLVQCEWETFLFRPS